MAVQRMGRDRAVREPAWHALSPEACLEALHASTSGVDEGEAAVRRASWGRNVLPAAVPPSFLGLFARQFQSPLIYLLLAAAILSLAIGHGSDAGFIAIVLTLNALLGAVQERRAAASLKTLQDMVHPIATVRRGGAVQQLDASELVPGDVILIEAGASVPADARLLRASNLTINEAPLTGEALPVAKLVGPAAPATAQVADRATMLHAGSTAASGRGEAVVVATGARTQLGQIAETLRLTPPALPPLVTYLHRLSRQIAIGVVLLVLLLSAALLARGAGAQEIFLLAVALAVSAIPEGLPVSVTVALTSAAHRMARRNVIVRNLPAVEGLGACDLIATDKTGTLTINRLTAEVLIFVSGERLQRSHWSALGDRLEVRALATAAAICNEAARGPDGKPIGDSVDVALLEMADDVLAEPIAAERLALFAYEPENRFASVAAREGEHEVVYAKGAVETLAAMCTHPRQRLLEAAQVLAGEGYRVIAVARGPAGPKVNLAAPTGLDLIGAIGLIDPLRPEAIEAIRQCGQAGIGIRMITGDHPATALKIAQDLGIASDEAGLVTGTALTEAGTAAAGLIAAGHVFARIDPVQKLQIVEMLKAQGHIVAVTGDGVNDAPALQAAQIGVAMGRGGTDAARSVADLVIADDNFASIVAGVREGRVTFANLRRVVIFTLATGVAEIGMFLGAVLLGLPMPLTAVQLLWSNIVTNGVQDVALGFGKGDGNELAQPVRSKRATLIDRRGLLLLCTTALATAAMALLILHDMLARGYSPAEARNAVLMATVLFQNGFALSVRSDLPLWRAPIASNPWLILASIAATVLHGFALIVPPLARILGTSLPDLYTLTMCLGSTLLMLMAAELVKACSGGRSTEPPQVRQPPIAR